MFHGEIDWWTCWPCTKNTTLDPKLFTYLETAYGKEIKRCFTNMKTEAEVSC